MKRAPGESFEEYRQRRKEDNIIKKSIGRVGRWFHTGGTYRKKPLAACPSREIVSAASGKRHKGESLQDFRDRRRVCNAKRREREAICR